ncbi:MAG: DUF3883 domain-containing protein, partial [Ureaplasma sp.]|nr:DUF3883 domain-containing protein [Ureaplasma sp.]
LKPIISANLQSFNFSTIEKIWNIKYKKPNLFDYVIIDEASQASWKYIPFLLYTFKNIIAVGDENQLPPKEINDLTCHVFNELKENDFNEELNDFKKNKNQYLGELKTLLKELKLFDFEEKKFINCSVLDWINNNFEVDSELKTSSYDDKLITQKGLFLLEHFRCPYHLFKLFNESFYKNTLIYNKDHSHESCSFSKDSDLLCNETSFIQLKYDFVDNNTTKNTNLEEVKIALNFIVDNLKHFLEHNKASNERKIENINEDCVKYLINNILLISFYNNQNDLFKKTLKEITSNLDNYLENKKDIQNLENDSISYGIFRKIKTKYNLNQIFWINKFLKKLKYGTIDSTQGIGADFIIICNVSEFVFNEKKKYFRYFENDYKRINVFWSRTKQHFIQIISNNYWENAYKIHDSKLDNESSKGLNARELAEIFLDEHLNKIVFNVDWKKLNDNLSIENLWNTYKYKDETKDLRSKLNYIDKHGEIIFNHLVNDSFFAKLLFKKAYNELDWKIKFLNNTNWVNKEFESGKQFDFNVNDDYFIDVKSTINNGNLVYISHLEKQFAKEHSAKYLIAKINDIRKFNLNIRNKSSMAFIFNKLSFYKFIDEKLKNNNNDTIEYEIRKD